MDIGQALDLVGETIACLTEISSLETNPHSWRYYEELIAKHRILEAQIQAVYDKDFLNG